MKALVCIFICILHVSYTISCSLSIDTLQEKSSDLDCLLSLQTTNTWREFSTHGTEDTLMTPHKVAWLWSLTFKSKRAMRLNELTIQWRGNKIDQIHASLYQKNRKDIYPIPIQENLVGDGTWNAKTQKITFKLREKIVATNQYYLVLNFPKTLERTLKTGTFSVSSRESLKLSALQ